MGNAFRHQLISRGLADILSVVGHMTALGLDQSCNGLERGGLPGTVGTDQGNDLTLSYMEGDILDGMDHTIVYIQIFYFKYIFHPTLLNLPDKP